MSMASTVSAFGAYLADSFKVFALPVTTIRRASERGLTVASSIAVLVFLTIVAGLLRLTISYVPGGLSGPVPFTQLVLEEVSYFLFFALSLLVLFALIVVVGGKTDLARLFSAKLSLGSAIVGGFGFALLAKLVIGLLFFGSTEGVAGGLVVLGEQFGTIAIGLILAVYTIIVARFGGQLSWTVAAIVGVIHLLLMAAIFAAYDLMVLDGSRAQFQQLLQQ